MHILIIDDEPEVCASIAAVLEAHGMTCEIAPEALSAKARLGDAGAARFDLVLLDQRLPGKSGRDLLAALRAEGNSVPVIFVSAADDVDERVRGLRSGADDYIVKPFSPSELIARIEAVERRRHALPVVQVGDLVVDLGRRSLTRSGQRIELSPREFDLLVELLDAQGEPCPRERLLRNVWGLAEDTGTNVVEVQVARLRRKIDRGRDPLVHTVQGVGYRLGIPSSNDRARSA